MIKMIKKISYILMAIAILFCSVGKIDKSVATSGGTTNTIVIHKILVSDDYAKSYNSGKQIEGYTGNNLIGDGNTDYTKYFGSGAKEVDGAAFIVLRESEYNNNIDKDGNINESFLESYIKVFAKNSTYNSGARIKRERYGVTENGQGLELNTGYNEKVFIVELKQKSVYKSNSSGIDSDIFDKKVLSVVKVRIPYSLNENMTDGKLHIYIKGTADRPYITSHGTRKMSSENAYKDDNSFDVGEKISLKTSVKLPYEFKNYKKLELNFSYKNENDGVSDTSTRAVRSVGDSSNILNGAEATIEYNGTSSKITLGEDPKIDLLTKLKEMSAGSEGSSSPEKTNVDITINSISVPESLLSSGGNRNKIGALTATVTYANNIDKGGDESSTGSTLYIKTGGNVFKKIDARDGDENDGKPLEGVEFVLTKNEQDKKKVYTNDGWIDYSDENKKNAKIFRSDVNGIVELNGFEYGGYELEEVKVLEGYSLPENGFKFSILADSYSSTYENPIELENSKKLTPSEMPVTGGIGALIFISSGIFLVSIALFGIVRSRRNEA